MNLMGCNIGDGGSRLISTFLKTNSTLTTLSLSANKIGDIGVSYISEALKINSTISTILLTTNSQITTNGVRSILEALQFNTTLTELQLTFYETTYLSSIWHCLSSNKIAYKYRHWPKSHKLFSKKEQKIFEELMLIFIQYSIPRDLSVYFITVLFQFSISFQLN
uniref:Uncharacterized protein n=1 Tax=Arcella intermedia TaxID=1963864 RepID=A0A6B2LIN5_9EUKA